MKKLLTPKGIDALKPPPNGKRMDVMDSIVPGFGVRVTDSGHKSFILLARYPGSDNPTRRSIGRVGALDLADAREIAREWLLQISQGLDPKVERDKLRMERQEEAIRLARRRPLEEVLDEYEAEHLSRLRTGKATRRALDGEKGLLRVFLGRDPSSISRSDLRQEVKRRAKSAPISANRQLAYTKAFFNWCLTEEIIDENPAMHIRSPSPERERDRFHSIEELQEIWSAALRLGYPFSHFTRLAIVLPMRRDEIASMRLSELSLSTDNEPLDSVWILPAERTKTGRALRVPLSKLARQIILEAKEHPARSQESDFLFTTTGRTAISGFAKAKKKLDRLIAESRGPSECSSASTVATELDHWIWHDFRTTFATLAADELSIDPQVADRCLNHQASATRSKISRIYNRSELFEPRKQALCSWAKFLESRVIDNGTPETGSLARPRS